MANPVTDIDSQVSGFFAIKSIDAFLPNLIQVKEATKSAREKITNAVIGLAILAVVWVLWRLITYFLGLTPNLRGPFRINIPTP